MSDYLLHIKYDEIISILEQKNNPIAILKIIHDLGWTHNYTVKLLPAHLLNLERQGHIKKHVIRGINHYTLVNPKFEKKNKPENKTLILERNSMIKTLSYEDKELLLKIPKNKWIEQTTIITHSLKTKKETILILKNLVNMNLLRSNNVKQFWKRKYFRLE